MITRYPLLVRVLGGVLAIVAAAIGAVAYSESVALEREMDARVGHEVGLLAALLPPALADPIIRQETAAARRILSVAGSIPGVSFVRIISPGGGEFTRFDNSVGSGESPAITRKAELRAPVPPGHQLEVGYARNALDALLAGFWRRTLAWGALILGAAAALTVAAGYYDARRLARLANAAGQVASGDYPHVEVQGSDEIGRAASAFNIMTDSVRERMQSLAELKDLAEHHLRIAREGQARFAALLSAMGSGILFADSGGRIQFCNPAFRRLFALGDRPACAGESLAQMQQMVGIGSLPANSPDAEPELPGFSDGRETRASSGRIVRTTKVPVRGDSGSRIGTLWLFDDVTSLRQTSEQLAFLSERDPLTALPNRRAFLARLEEMLGDSARGATPAAVFILDVDQFKLVNESTGHRRGDALLIDIGHRLLQRFGDRTVIARIGGDEFGLLAPGLDGDGAQRLAEEVVAEFQAGRLDTPGGELPVTVSLGVAFFPAHGHSAEELVTHADSAMYHAKESGRNTWRAYDRRQDPTRRDIERITWRERIRAALDGGGLVLAFQGVYRTDPRALSHLEVLVRMREADAPEKLVSPGLFIPIAEATGQITAIDRVVLARTIEWLALGPDVPDMAVNISGRSFDDPTLPEYIGHLLKEHSIDPRRLLVELTETSAISDLRDAQRFISALRELGCRVCLDDFGSGFSSFAYLKHLDVDLVKIDGMFVRELEAQRDNQIFVKALVDVAKGLGKVTVAESVEDAATLELLSGFGVEFAQGFYLDRPVLDHPALPRLAAGPVLARAPAPQSAGTPPL